MSEYLIASSSFVLCALFTLPAAAAAMEPAAAPDAVKGVVYVLDGSGRLRLMADDLACAVEDAQLGLEVIDINWSHGSCRIFADLRSTTNHQEQGEKLAERILAQRTDCPKSKVYIVAHSAGAAVAMAAAEHLPAGAVERFILLAPAVSSSADLGPSLQAARAGVDVFYSHTDLICRSLSLVGCTDGWSFFSAGTSGFTSVEECNPKLRQHSYSWDMTKANHFGGHYGWTRSGVLREYVVPLLAGSICEVARSEESEAPAPSRVSALRLENTAEGPVQAGRSSRPGPLVADEAPAAPSRAYVLNLEKAEGGLTRAARRPLNFNRRVVGLGQSLHAGQEHARR